MTKITLNNVGSLIEATTAAATINSNNSTIQVAFDNTLSRDGTAPNVMNASLDLNSNQILNLPAPAGPNSPLRLQDLSDFTGGGTVSNIPVGGTTGQVLAKHSNANFDTGWTNSVTSVGLALPSDFTITGSPIVNTTGTLTGAWAVAPTGSGAVVRANTPTLVTPVLGTPASGNMINCNLPLGSISGLAGGVAGFLSSPSSANLATALSDETGTGSAVFATSPTLVTPLLGTPTSGVLTNCTGTAAGLTAGSVTTNANLTGVVTSVGNTTSLGSFTSANLKTALTDETGSGAAVFATSPALVTPTGIVKGDVGLGNVDNTSDVTKWAATKTLTNTTYDTAGTGNSFSINGVAATANTGTGSVVRATSPTLVTPVLGVATATTLNGVTLDNTAWTSYAATATAQTPGVTPPTFTRNGARYKQIGKLIFLSVDFTVTAQGTGTGAILITLPFTAATATTTYAGNSLEYSAVGIGGWGLVGPGATTFTVKSSITASPFIVTGQAIAASIFYEIP